MSDREMKAEKLMAFLQKNKTDRGVMADLRAGFSEATEYRAWSHLAQFCSLTGFDRIVVQTVAAGFATQPECANKGNLGTTMRAIAGGNKDGLASFEGRFRRLLTCSDTEEICRFVPGIIRTAKAKGIAVNYRRLYTDLCYWNGGRTKVQWAEAYWGTAGGDQ
ncbi:type I-E CRISPR-associated protein Cse2/CasB [Pontiellaceae bacterium B12219]|nr:type I-E CRISPR-associated protein Cse2/CasB [Pontiellaceae bacterium B12219]